MSAPRTPRVLGLHRGAGTTTVARALHADDGGSRGVGADLVVCTGTEESLLCAGALAVGGARPWLAVVVLEPGRVPDEARLLLAARRCAGCTLLPHVGLWLGRTQPADDLSMLLGLRPDQLASTVRAYAAGLRAIAAGLVNSGLLDQARAPVVATPRTAAPPRPVVGEVVSSRRLPASAAMRVRPVSPAGDDPGRPDDLDDEALERAVQLLGTR